MAVAEPPPPTPDVPRWPLWLPLAGIGCGVTFGLIVLSVIAGIAHRTSSPGLTAAGTVVIDVSVVVACVLFAGLVTRPKPAQFGLRGAVPKFTAQVAALGALAYFLFSVVYEAIVRPNNPQKVVESLGADSNKLLLIVGALVVIAVAPICEELFFRGFMFAAFARRLGPAWGAVLAGGIFGLIHAPNPVLGLIALGVLGVCLCALYWRTQSIIPCMALHALNNSISFGVTKSLDAGVFVALVIGSVGVVVALATAVSSRTAVAA
jgi:membrane protease YdiL (CAAX protease family)